MPADSPPFVAKAANWVLLAAGAVGLGAAFALMVEKVRLLENPTYTPVCSFDAVLSCASVMTSDQAEAFGFPNPLLGIAGFGAVTGAGLCLVAGAQLPRWCWLVLQGGLTFAVVFVHWLFFQSVYRIEALCPFCMVVWLATIVAFVYLTLANLAGGRLPLPGRADRLARGMVQYHSLAVVAWLGVLTALIGVAFWDHWQTVL